MKKRLFLVVSLIAAIIFTQSSFAADPPKYSYDKDKTSIYAEFSAVPETVTRENWITELAGGKDASLKIHLGTAQADERRETRLVCIEITGSNGTRSFLSSGLTNNYFEDTNRLRTSRLIFRTGTQTYDKTFTKGSAIPMSVTLQAEFDQDEKLLSLKLGFSDNGEEVQNSFWQNDVSENMYACDFQTLNVLGDLIDCLNGRPVQENPLMPPAPAQDSEKIIRYDFDNVEVLQAAEFKAFPTSLKEGSWIYDLAGGNGKNIDILYGKVKLLKNNNEITEDFISISGENGSERFLSNSTSYEYYENSYKYKSVRISLWSGKQLEGSTVVKDYSKPVKEVVLHMNFDTDQNFTDIRLGFLYDSVGRTWDYTKPEVFENEYKCDMGSLTSYGINHDNDNKVSNAGDGDITDVQPNSENDITIPTGPVEVNSTVGQEEEKVRYDFDEAEYIYDLVFKIKTGDKINEPWIKELAGHNDKSLSISYGKLNLKKNGESVGTEQYIEISGENGSRRFLCNNMSYEVDSNNNLKGLRLLFWEGTKIVANKVMKVYSDKPSKAVVMQIDVDENLQAKSIQLYFAEKKWATIQHQFFSTDVFESTCSADTDTLVQNGKFTKDIENSQTQAPTQTLDVAPTTDSINNVVPLKEPQESPMTNNN